MSTFARTPGNSPAGVLERFVTSPKQRVQRILQVTLAAWKAQEELSRRQRDARPAPAFGPGRRPLGPCA